MPDQSIVCPKCGTKIQLTDALRHQVEEELRSKLGQEFSKKEKTLSEELEKKEQSLMHREARLKRGEKALDEKVEEEIKGRLEELSKKAQKEAEEKVTIELKERDERLEENKKALEKYRENELELRKKAREFEAKTKEIDLEVERKVDDRGKAIEEKVRSAEAEKWGAKLKTKDEELARIRKQVERAGQAGLSGELAGEVAEITLEERLRQAFEEDQVEPIGRGKIGADILQSVESGGSILWESKTHYTSWSKEWVTKLKRDRDETKASVGVLVSTIGPEGKGVQAPTMVDGIVLAPPWMAVAVASLLRPQLKEIARQRRLFGKQETLQAEVYAWVTSQEFQRGIAAIGENLQRLEREVARAKVNHAKWYKHMEVEVGRTVRSLAEFYGSARGQARLPDLPVFALLPADGESGEEPTESESKDKGETEK